MGYTKMLFTMYDLNSMNTIATVPLKAFNAAIKCSAVVVAG